MNKKINTIKKILTLLLVFFFSIDSFAAAVSDNDGAAFITKAEFDSLKNEFKAQLDRFNTGIDNKIDNAISSYLSGVKVGKQHKENSLLREAMTNYVITFNQGNPLKYDFGWPRIGLDLTQTRWNNGSRDNIGTAHVSADPIEVSDATKISKTLITKLARKDTSSPWTAEWAGYRINCSDVLQLYGYYSSADGIDGNPGNIGLINLTKQDASNCNLIKNQDLIGKGISPAFRTCVGTDRGTGSSPMLLTGTIRDISHDWGENKYPIAVCWQPYNYDMF